MGPSPHRWVSPIARITRGLIPTHVGGEESVLLANKSCLHVRIKRPLRASVDPSDVWVSRTCNEGEELRGTLSGVDGRVVTRGCLGAHPGKGGVS